jgi:signal transduction histidine kinase
MQHDDRGTLWLSAGGKLLQVADGRVRVPPAPVPVIGKVRSLHRDGEGTLWLGTFDGLVRQRGGAWHLFGADAGLPGDVYQVVTDRNGFLWAGTSQGIVRVSTRVLADIEAGRRRYADAAVFHATDQRREVDASRSHQPGAWRGGDGRLWFATSRGVVSVDPARLRVNPYPPAVRIERAFVDGRPAGRGATNRFPPGSGALEFHFAGITLLEPQRAQHRYRLEGFDHQWVEAGTRRVAYYTNIGPGRYRFRVQASNADGVWNEAGDAVDFTLAPHLHQTWWFYGLCAAGLLGLGFSFHRLRVAQVHSRYAATFAERNRFARELHDSLLQGMAAALLQLRTVRKRLAPAAPAPPADAVRAELEAVENLIGANMEETRQLVWDLREQAPGAAPIEPALGQLVRRAAERSSIDVRLHAEGAATALPPRIRRELLRIAQEALSNALTHAQARHVEVRVTHDQDSVRLSVHDDGRGFDPGAAPGSTTGHFGLVGMRERAAAIGALAIESQPGRGTTVEVTIRKRERGNG